MRLNELGKIVAATWGDLPNHIFGIELDQFVVMPNHIHGIITIVGAGSKPAHIVRQLKTFSSRRINKLRDVIGMPIWQRNYYEHIIRNENDFNQIRKYINDNPLKWELDEYYI